MRAFRTSSPTLLRYPDLPAQHSSDSRNLALPTQAGESRFGVVVSRGRLLTETVNGRRYWLRLLR